MQNWRPRFKEVFTTLHKLQESLSPSEVKKFFKQMKVDTSELKKPQLIGKNKFKEILHSMLFMSTEASPVSELVTCVKIAAFLDKMCGLCVEVHFKPNEIKLTTISEKQAAKLISKVKDFIKSKYEKLDAGTKSLLENSKEIDMENIRKWIHLPPGLYDGGLTVHHDVYKKPASRKRSLPRSRSAARSSARSL